MGDAVFRTDFFIAGQKMNWNVFIRIIYGIRW